MLVLPFWRATISTTSANLGDLTPEGALPRLELQRLSFPAVVALSER